MTQEIEIEFKNLLTEEEFLRLACYFHITEHDFKLQENHYFDTQDFQLKENGSALRIRNKNDQYILTLKEPAPVGILETHQVLNKEKAGQILFSAAGIPAGQIMDRLQTLGIDSESITFFGTLSTNRAEKRYKKGLIVLDHSRYLNKEDHEIEYEVSDAESGLAIFHGLLSELQIPIRETPNKIKRFYDQKYKRKIE